MGAEELRILVVEGSRHDFVSICDHVARASGSRSFSIDHVNSAAEATELCGIHYQVLIVDARTAATEEEAWSKCRMLLEYPCVVLLLVHRHHAEAIVQPAARNRNQFVIRTGPDGPAIEMAIRHALKLMGMGRCSGNQLSATAM
jgi:hypothetical protein